MQVSTIGSQNSTSSPDGDGESDRISVSVTRLRDAIVLTAIGEIDMNTAPTLDNAIQRSLAEQPGTLVINLDQARFVASAGISVLVLAHSRSAAGSLRIVAQDQAVLRVLKRTGLARDLAVHRTVESALAG